MEEDDDAPISGDYLHLTPQELHFVELGRQDFAEGKFMTLTEFWEQWEVMKIDAKAQLESQRQSQFNRDPE